MKKKWTSLLAAFVMVFVLATGVQAQGNTATASEAVKVWINDDEVQFGANAPVVVNGTTLVPVRAVLESLGYALAWDEDEQVVVAEKYGFSIAVQIGNPVGGVNGASKELAIAPQILKGSTYVPIAFISEAIGYELKWDAASRTVLLSKEASKGYLWKVEKDGAEVYLMGSIHVGDPNLYPLRDEVEQAFDDADHLVVEVDITKAGEESVQKEIAAIQVYSDGSTLKDHVSGDTYARVQSFLEEIGLESNAYDTYKPWSVNLDMTNYAAAVAGYQGGIGIDMYYLNRALATEKPILELESFTSQLGLFDSFSKELQESQLNETLDGIFGVKETTEPTINALADLWIQGDDKGLEALVSEIQKQEEFYEKLIKKRHTGMLEKIEGYLNNEKKESYFVVAGYLHMLGKDGLVTLLQEKGYTVTRI
ncbi:TraB/GumN family protein [Paenibacillus paeoniae]|uniref:Polysaccharide biosynthesis protein GumN n=1 Tax=Paenibacillus paeoniae TaxID=2292705 RepID=A0A371PFL8_9BACL|nr:TraB/GumN family protein [Paenibacillus paeoniae]REK74739.1 polysaccharide biosynthesis protein GumN [Paenibacillus paeoniae]